MQVYYHANPYKIRFLQEPQPEAPELIFLHKLKKAEVVAAYQPKKKKLPKLLI